MTGIVLVTGAAGFIGSHLSKALCERDWKVVGIDNFNDYYDVTLKEARLRSLQPFKNFQCLRLDINDREGMSRLFKDSRFTHVVNLAAQAGIRHSLDHPHSYVESNIAGFLNVLEGCRHFPVHRLIYASSSSVYGASSDVPFTVQDRADKPISLYGATKRANELMAHAYATLFGIPAIGVRFFTVYGPWGRPDMAYFLFTQAIMQEKAIKLYNHGRMKRDFTFVDDVTSILAQMLSSDPRPTVSSQGVPSGTALRSDTPRIYNLGHGHPESLGDLVAILEHLLGKKAKKEMLQMQPGDLAETHADISELERDYDVRPSTALKDGLEKFVEWYRGYYASS